MDSTNLYEYFSSFYLVIEQYLCNKFIPMSLRVACNNLSNYLQNMPSPWPSQSSLFVNSVVRQKTSNKILFLVFVCNCLYLCICVLLQLKDTKSADQKTTLLHFLAQICEEEFPNVIKFVEDLEHVDRASRGNIQHYPYPQISTPIHTLLPPQRFLCIIYCEFLSMKGSLLKLSSNKYLLFDNLITLHLPPTLSKVISPGWSP